MARDKISKKRVKQLYYITHIGNLSSILRLGILSHERIEADQVPYERIYDADIVASRRDRTVPGGRSLWGFANLYFQPRNAMLYRVLLTRPLDEIVVIGVDPDILAGPDAFISLGNAASFSSDIVPSGQGRTAIPEILKWIDNDWWTEEVGLKRKMMAEVLVPDGLPSDSIRAIHVGNHAAVTTVRAILGSIPSSERTPEVVLEPRMFFAPVRSTVLTPNLSVVEGDMFFSKMQTLTVSVNTVGIMGKGLASRAKYQFPDVYVRYQDVCRAKRLRMGVPYLYKRESSLEHELAADSHGLANANSETWFLLFATKRHWREDSDISAIGQGLQWIVDNYKQEGIQSLAVPALGCGLGRLDWRDVGPLIARSLATIEIPTRIYLPAETKVPDELLKREFLLP